MDGNRCGVRRSKRSELPAAASASAIVVRRGAVDRSHWPIFSQSTALSNSTTFDDVDKVNKLSSEVSPFAFRIRRERCT
jgi:hypothetical protein